MESRVSESDFTPQESVSAEEAVSTVLTDKDLDGGSDEVFSEDTSEEKRKKKRMSRCVPSEKKAKTPGTAQIKRPAMSANNRKTLKAKRIAVRVNRSKIEENCIVC